MITITKGGISLRSNTFLFPAGEVGIKLDVNNHRYCYNEAPHQTIWARLQGGNDVMQLIMTVDALRRFDPTPIRLVLSYVPYARQDRVCVPGESFSLKAFAQMVNALRCQSVTVFDPHSDVTGAVFDNVVIVPQSDIIGRFTAFNARLHADERPVFVSPDAGANKRTADLAALYGHSMFVRADKLRDLGTGKIKEIVVVNPREEVEGRDCVIVDDLCDAGGTFIGLAAALKAKGARRIELYVTHGLFTKGTTPLYKGGIDAIWTTNSFYAVWPAGISDEVKTLKLEEVYHL